MIDSILQYLDEKMKKADQEGYEISHKGYPQKLICVNGITHCDILCNINIAIIQPILKHKSLPQEIKYEILLGKTANGAMTIINTAVLQKLINFIETVKKYY